MRVFQHIILLITLCGCPGLKNRGLDLDRSGNARDVQSFGELPENTTPTREKVIETALLNGDITDAVERAVEPVTTECHNGEVSAAPPAAESLPNTCESQRYSEKQVLYIGDSHSYLRSADGNRMGNQVVTQLRQCGAAGVQYHGVCGSRPSSWMPGRTPSSTCGVSTITNSGFSTASNGRTRNIEQLQQDQNPGVVIINLGDNMFGWSSGRSSINQDRVVSEVSALVGAIDEGRDCIWIGPTYHSPGSSYTKTNAHVDQMYTAIQRGLNGRCELVDSRPVFSSTRPNDGLHLTESESTQWGNSIGTMLSTL